MHILLAIIFAHSNAVSQALAALADEGARNDDYGSAAAQLATGGMDGSALEKYGWGDAEAFAQFFYVGLI
jgi:hypothetical protein